MKEITNLASYVKNTSVTINRLEAEIKYGKGPTRKRAIDDIIYNKQQLQKSLITFAKELDTSIQKDELLYDIE